MGLRKTRPGKPKGSSINDMGTAPVVVPWVVWTASSCVMCSPREKQATRYPWRDSALPRSLSRGIPLLLLIVLVCIFNGVIQCEEVVVLLVVLPFSEAFQRRFEGLDVLLLHLHLLEGYWADRYLWLLIQARNSSRRVKGLLNRWRRMTQAEVLRKKCVSYLPRPRIQGMALDASLHPNRPHLLPKMLVRIADDFLCDGIRQQVVRFILDGDARHGDAPRKVMG